MTALINASTTSGLITTADTSGTLALQSNGTTQLTVSSTGAYGQLKSATAQASTSGTSIDFTSIPSWVKRITVILNGVSTNGSSNYLVQLGDADGIEATGYLGSSSYSSTGSTTVAFTTGVGLHLSSVGAGVVVAGSIVLTNVSSNTWVASGSVAMTQTAAFVTTAGNKSLSDVLTQVRITTVNGTDTFDAGSINILYEG